MKRRLLLVEDDEVFLRPLHRTLELKGYEVLPVQSGEEALDTLKSEDVDLVLTDRRLAGMDGVELVRQVKAEHPDLAVLVMTAYGTIESAVEAMRLGAEDYLVKPFETAELLLVIRRAIEFQELSRPTAGPSGGTRSASPSAISSPGARACRGSSTSSAPSSISIPPS